MKLNITKDEIKLLFKKEKTLKISSEEKERYGLSFVGNELIEVKIDETLIDTKLRQLFDVFGRQDDFQFMFKRAYKIQAKNPDKIYGALNKLFQPEKLNISHMGFGISNISFYINKTYVCSVDLDYDFDTEIKIKISCFIENASDGTVCVKEFDEIIGIIEEGLKSV